MRDARNRWVLFGGIVAALVLLLASCGYTQTLDGRASAVPTLRVGASPTTAPATSPTTTPPTSDVKPAVDFTPAVKTAVSILGDADVSIAIYDRNLNKLVAGWHTEDPFYTESVVKLLIGLDSLDHGQSATRVSEMVSRSDDVTATSLWDSNGGTAILERMSAKIGLHHTTPPGDGKWGDTRITAGDLLLVYQYILDIAPTSERDVMISAMHHATNLGADGTDQWFGIPYAVGGRTPWAVKQGWACCEPGWVLNTTGVVGPGYRYIVIVLTSHDNGSGARSEDSAELTKAVSALVPDLTAS